MTDPSNEQSNDEMSASRLTGDKGKGNDSGSRMSEGVTVNAAATVTPATQPERSLAMTLRVTTASGQAKVRINTTPVLTPRTTTVSADKRSSPSTTTGNNPHRHRSKSDCVSQPPASNAAIAASSTGATVNPIVASPISSSSSSPSYSSPSPSPTAASASACSADPRHLAYLRALADARAAKLREERRRKVPKSERLTAASTVVHHQRSKTMPSQNGKSRTAAASSPQSPSVSSIDVGRPPRVFSILGGSAADSMRAALSTYGWVENKDEWSREWSLQWSIANRIIDHGSLLPNQIVNHIEGAHSITSKTGLLRSLYTNAATAQADHASFFPRCFEVHQHEKEDLRHFHLQFRREAAMKVAWKFVETWKNLHKIDDNDAALSSSPPSDSLSVVYPLQLFNHQVLQLCLIALESYLRRLRHECDGVDNELEACPKQATEQLTDPSTGLAMREYADLTEAEWEKVERLAEEMDRIEREHEQRCQQQMGKQAPTLDIDTRPMPSPAVSPSLSPSSMPSSATSNADDTSSPDEHAGFTRLQTNQANQSRRLSPPLHSITPATSSSPDAFDNVDSNSPDLSIVTRTPLPLPTLYSHFIRLRSSLRACDSQHFTLTYPHCRNLWIVKPAGLSRGRGIELISNMTQLMRILAKGGKFVVQKYIERPLLVRRKKFDIRQWVLITNFSHVRSIWFHSRDAYCRFSSADFTMSQLDPIIHLTNNSIQKNGEEFDALDFAKGNMWSSQQFAEWLDTVKHTLPLLDEARKYSSGKQLWTECIQPQMKNIAKLAIHSGEDSFTYRPHCFTLLGFDFMVCDDLSVWLIEVNSSPTMQGISIPHIVDNMIRDLFHIVLHDQRCVCSEEYWRKKEEARKKIQEECEAEVQTNGATADGAESEPRNRRAAGSKAAATSRKSPQRSLSSSALPRVLPSTAPPPSTGNGAAVAPDPFILPIPHAVGECVGVWEVIDSSFIGTIPKQHRQKVSQHQHQHQQQAVTTHSQSQPASISDQSTQQCSPSASRACAMADKKKPTSAQPSGLYVVGKALRLRQNGASAASAGANTAAVAIKASVPRAGNRPAAGPRQPIMLSTKLAAPNRC